MSDLGDFIIEKGELKKYLGWERIWRSRRE